jgi:hypothetical protein
MDKNNYCELKDCRFRKCLKEIPEDKRDYSENYPFNAYGYECHVPCGTRVKEKQNDKV